jgi:hypothetical protein
MHFTRLLPVVVIGIIGAGGYLPQPAPRRTPDPDAYTREAALRMARAARGQLAESEGLGIDVGGGPGTLAVELCRRTPRMYWTNADINPHFGLPLLGA